MGKLVHDIDAAKAAQNFGPHFFFGSRAEYSAALRASGYGASPQRQQRQHQQRRQAQEEEAEEEEEHGVEPEDDDDEEEEEARPARGARGGHHTPAGRK